MKKQESEKGSKEEKINFVKIGRGNNTLDNLIWHDEQRPGAHYYRHTEITAREFVALCKLIEREGIRERIDLMGYDQEGWGGLEFDPESMSLVESDRHKKDGSPRKVYLEFGRHICDYMDNFKDDIKKPSAFMEKFINEAYREIITCRIYSSFKSLHNNLLDYVYYEFIRTEGNKVSKTAFTGLVNKLKSNFKEEVSIRLHGEEIKANLCFQSIEKYEITDEFRIYVYRYDLKGWNSSYSGVIKVRDTDVIEKNVIGSIVNKLFDKVKKEYEEYGSDEP